MREARASVLAVVLLWGVAGCGEKEEGVKGRSESEGGGKERVENPLSPEGGKQEEKDWVSLVPEEGMGKWEVIPFGGVGEIGWKDGVLTIEEGAELAGVVWKGELPTVPYEIAWEGRRTSGVDFFGALTLPVRKETSVTFVNGGWGGGIVGISCIDGMDASENETTEYMAFDNGKWYAFRVRVEENRLEAWVGEEQVAKVETEGRKLGLRFGDIERCAPLGFATWQTAGEVRKVRWKAVKGAGESEE